MSLSGYIKIGMVRERGFGYDRSMVAVDVEEGYDSVYGIVAMSLRR